jgi:hypothetical protein
MGGGGEAKKKNEVPSLSGYIPILFFQNSQLNKFVALEILFFFIYNINMNSACIVIFPAVDPSSHFQGM